MSKSFFQNIEISSKRLFIGIAKRWRQCECFYYAHDT